jgi:hypothetical protein
MKTIASVEDIRAEMYRGINTSIWGRAIALIARHPSPIASSRWHCELGGERRGTCETRVRGYPRLHTGNGRGSFCLAQDAASTRSRKLGYLKLAVVNSVRARTLEAATELGHRHDYCQQRPQS